MFLGHDQVVELVTNLDLLRRRMRITSAFVEVRGQLVEGTPKTHQMRTVPLPRFLVERAGGA